MDTDEGAQGILLGRGDGREVRVGPNRLAVKVDDNSCIRLFGVFESAFPPGAGIVAHRHRSYEEVFYVLEGEIEYRLDARRRTATSGDCVLVPAGVAHAFRNVGVVEARHLVIHAPAHALEMIEELGRARPEQFGDVLGRYDSELVEELVERSP